MRTLLILSLFAASLVHAAWGDYEEERELTVSADGLRDLRIDAAAGKLIVTGDADAEEIRVIATIVVPGSDAEEAAELMASSMELTLERRGNSAELASGFSSGGGWFRDSPVIHLEVVMPGRLALTIDDTSGSMKVSGIDGDIRIDDNSGSITVRDAGGNVRIDDGSGSIEVVNVGLDVDIEDGSGSIKVRDVGGSVSIDDGSGSIRVDNVEQNLVIIDDGSGSLSYNNIRGEIDDRS